MLYCHPHDVSTSAVHAGRQDSEDVSPSLHLAHAAPEGLEWVHVQIDKLDASAAYDATDKVSQTCRPSQAPQFCPWHDIHGAGKYCGMQHHLRRLCHLRHSRV